MNRILIVDDEKEIRSLIKEKLEQNNYEAITASSGQEALSVYKINPPDLILLDIAMPGIDGYQTAEEIRKDPGMQNVPILFLTGKDIEEDSIIQRCQRISNCGYIPKLFTLKELLKVIQENIKK